MTTVALIQADSSLAAVSGELRSDLSGSQAVMDRILGQLAALPSEVEFVVLPELWTIGAFSTERFIPSAIDLADPTSGNDIMAELASVARAKGFWLHAGSFIERDADQYFNTSVVFDDSGNQVARYRKIHLFGFGGGEAQILSSGTDVVVLDTPLGRTGLSTCYDLRFPELFRAQREQGAEAFVIPSGWPRVRVAAWRTLAVARAMENQAWVLGCNAVGRSGPLELAGGSLIAAPDGTVVAEAAAAVAQVLVAEVEPADVSQLRGTFPVHGDRRL